MADETGRNRGKEMLAAAAEARQHRLARAPAGVNASRWLATQQGQPLSVDRVKREARVAIRQAGQRVSAAANPVRDAYLDALLEELAPTLRVIASIQESRKRTRSRRRRKPESTYWPTYWTHPEPYEGQVPVDDLTGDAKQRFRDFQADPSFVDACFAEFDATWRHEAGGEDRAMPQALSMMAGSACKKAAWYQRVLEWGPYQAPAGAYDAEYLDDLRAEEAQVMAAWEAPSTGDADDAGAVYDYGADDDIPF